MKTISKEELKELYDKDFPLWAEINYELLKEKAYELVDWENLLEEIQDMARSDLKACISHLAVILEHLYKWDNFRDLAGGETAGKGWINSVENARDRLSLLFENYPSLKGKLPQELQRAWKQARTELGVWLRNNDYNPEDFCISQECPYT
ncbi:MAG: DUF29 domain-containing protein, partial [Aquificaceae bacterium]|nr:DUF29 domain-containing protein [Aquificaceae bacterium]